MAKWPQIPPATAPVKRERDSGIDLVKVCAMYFVLSLHFLLTVLASFPVFYLGKFISWLIMKPLFWLTSLPQRKAAKSDGS